MYRLQDGLYSRIWITDGILYFVYHSIELLDKRIAQAIVKERLTYQAGESFPVLCMTRGIQDANKAARDYLALEGSHLARAVAVVEDRIVAHNMIKLYLKRNKPLTPTEVFKEEYDALQFLKSFVKR